ncbi:DNA repair protein rhp7 isoform X1 [Iris pallida]|uniref:DNA repair protein rhp7 isoform X1 n=1 Tax=Iris pallida TaxID=29817 RepID=A0AAX6E595_IRIPA|nr:DNA repair protein rhp7 isoform X1 [Iris pallida]
MDQNPDPPYSLTGNDGDFDLNMSLEDFDLNFPLFQDPPADLGGPVPQNEIEVIDIDSDGDEEAAAPAPGLVDDDLLLWDLPQIISFMNDFPDLGDGDGGNAANHEPPEEVVDMDELRNSLREARRVEKAERQRENRERAIAYAPHFAVHKRKDSTDQDYAAQEKNEEVYRVYGLSEGDTVPFADAMKVVEKRGKEIRWEPAGRKDGGNSRRVPSLKDLSMTVLVENAEEIESLEGIPDMLKETLVSMLFSKRKMSMHVLGIYLAGSPVKVQLSDCSWAAEEEFIAFLGGLNCAPLSVLQLDLCGRFMTDYVLRATLAKSPRNLPSLTTISLKGAFRLSDDGLDALVTSAPLLSSVNLGGCNLLTSDGIINLANKLNPVLRELVLDDCQNVDAMVILPALKKLKFLEVLSIARIQNVDDSFVYNLVRVCGPQIKELVFADCQKLTTASMRAIGENCSKLCVLDIRNLVQLNDLAISHLASGCRSMQKLKLRRNKFSDEAIAAFIEASGGSLIELSLNHIVKVAEYTALAISMCCTQSLQSLDLSFCRDITDEALGLIVDSCSSLSFLTLFGCSQITDSFMKGHSNFNCKIIGFEGPILRQFKAPDFM